MFPVLLPLFGVFLSNGKAQIGRLASHCPALRAKRPGRFHQLMKSYSKSTIVLSNHQASPAFTGHSDLLRCGKSQSRQDGESACFTMQRAVRRDSALHVAAQMAHGLQLPSHA